MYLAPEVLAGQSPSAGADVYALGVMLYQLLIGDFRKPLAPGWEARLRTRCSGRISRMQRVEILPKGSTAQQILSSACLRWTSAGSSAMNWKRQDCGADCRAQVGRDPRPAALVVFAVIALAAGWQ